MSVFASLIILILSTLILASLQLIPGVFLLLSHYTSGKYPKKRASDLRIFFIFGAEVSITIIFLSIYFILCGISNTSFSVLNDIFIWVLSGILIALGIIVLLFYYRKGDGTKLFISRKAAKSFNQNASLVKSRSDAFILGALSPVPELFLTIPFFITSSFAISSLVSRPTERAILVLLLIIVAIVPLLVIHELFNTGHNLAEIERFRVHNKTFFKLFLSLLFFLLATTLMLLKVI